MRSRSALGNHLTIAGAYDRANNELRKVLEIDENAWFAHAAPARSSALKAMAPEALRCAETAYRSTSVGILFYQVMCQETETAAGWFEKAVEERDPTLIPFLRHPDETIAGQLPMAGAGQNDEPPANFRIVGALRNWAGSEFV